MRTQLLFMLFYQALNVLTGLTHGRQTQIKVKRRVVKVEMSFNDALSEKVTPAVTLLLSSPLLSSLLSFKVIQNQREGKRT